VTTEQKVPASHADGHAVMARVRAERFGFLTVQDVRAVAEDARTRLTLLLVRCQGCRFLAPAQDVAHLVAIIEQSSACTCATGGHSDGVRDVSLPAEVR
jgi:hypothetical protein